jgi:BlaI family transcriptional regulator, penicillinase repressor
MDTLWRRGDATARDVHGDLHDETGWAYTTVKTMLDRLVEKGALAGAKPDAPSRSATYRPLLARKQARLQAALGLVERAFGGSPAPLVHFLIDSEVLSDADRTELMARLAKRTEVQAPGEPEDLRQEQVEPSERRPPKRKRARQ